LIKIYSGWGNPGGSCVAFINLTNALNEAGYETIFYTPHTWPLNKCRSEQTSGKLQLKSEDTLILHFTDKIKVRPPVKKVIFVSHEKWWFEISKLIQCWDTVIFLSQQHRDYHKDYKGNFTIIPNLKENLIKKNKESLDNIAGIIGTIEPRKQTHISINRALQDNCEKIYLFGNVGDPIYFNNVIVPLIDNNPKIIMGGYIEDKQKIYDMIGRVYHSSFGEVASLVKDECYSTGTKFFGNNETNNEVSTLSNEEILKMWVKELDLFVPSNINFNKKLKISAYFPCYNEALLMPHLLKHYTAFCDKVTILDNYSTDNIEEIVKKFKNVVIEKFDSNGSFNDGIHAQLKNSVWKKDIGNFDFIIAADSDEFIWHPNFIDFLQEKKSKGYTLFRPFGYHMIGDVDLVIKEDDNIFEKVKYGIKVSSMDKYILFDCNKIKETNFSVGSHLCNPVGEVKLYYKNDLKLKHFKYLGLENHLAWCRTAKQRLSQYNIQNNMGTWYLEGDEYHTKDYMNYFNKRVLV